MVFSAKVPGQTSVPKRCNTNRPAIGGPFKLYDTEKNQVTESKLRGNWTLMYFGYTSCPDVGPAEVQKMADVVKLLGTLLYYPSFSGIPNTFHGTLCIKFVQHPLYFNFTHLWLAAFLVTRIWSSVCALCMCMFRFSYLVWRLKSHFIQKLAYDLCLFTFSATFLSCFQLSVIFCWKVTRNDVFNTRLVGLLNLGFCQSLSNLRPTLCQLLWKITVVACNE